MLKQHRIRINECMRGSRGGTGGPDPPLKHKNIGFLSNTGLLNQLYTPDLLRKGHHFIFIQNRYAPRAVNYPLQHIHCAYTVSNLDLD